LRKQEYGQFDYGQALPVSVAPLSAYVAPVPLAAQFTVPPEELAPEVWQRFSRLHDQPRP
jgi:hypothetical protein